MGRKEELQAKIYEIEDRIRKAPAIVSNKLVFDWYREIDALREEIESLDGGGLTSETNKNASAETEDSIPAGDCGCEKDGQY